MLLPIKVEAQNVEEVKIEYQTINTENYLTRPSDEVVNKLWEDYKVAQAKLKAKKTNYVSNKVACSCVLYAQALGLGLSGYGLAMNYPINSRVPALSGFVFTYESRPGTRTGHVAHYTLQVDNLLLDESNYDWCTITHKRLLPVSSPLIRGYVN